VFDPDAKQFQLKGRQMPSAIVEVQDLGKCFLADRVHTDVEEGLEGFGR
jgi:hypothetical protein